MKTLIVTVKESFLWLTVKLSLFIKTFGFVQGKSNVILVTNVISCKSFEFPTCGKISGFS